MLWGRCVAISGRVPAGSDLFYVARHALLPHCYVGRPRYWARASKESVRRFVRRCAAVRRVPWCQRESTFAGKCCAPAGDRPARVRGASAAAWGGRGEERRGPLEVCRQPQPPCWIEWCLLGPSRLEIDETSWYCQWAAAPRHFNLFRLSSVSKSESKILAPAMLACQCSGSATLWDDAVDKSMMILPRPMIYGGKSLALPKLASMCLVGGSWGPYWDSWPF